MITPSPKASGPKSLTIPAIAWIMVMVYAWLAAYSAGEISHHLSFLIGESGGPDYFREPINLGLALLALWLWRGLSGDGAPLAPTLGSPTWGLGGGWIVGCVLPGLALVLMAALGAGIFSPTRVQLLALILPIPFILIHALAEEVIIRGIAQRSAQRLYGPMAGIGLAALTFCILQATQGYGSVWHIVNSALFGAVLGFLALGRGGIWAAAAGHAGWTWLETSWIGDGVTFTKMPGFWAGFGPDSYGAPTFTVVLMFTLGLIGAGRALQARKDRQ